MFKTIKEKDFDFVKKKKEKPTIKIENKDEKHIAFMAIGAISIGFYLTVGAILTIGTSHKKYVFEREIEVEVIKDNEAITIKNEIEDKESNIINLNNKKLKL